MQALLMRKLNHGKDIFNELRHKSMKDFFFGSFRYLLLSIHKGTGIFNTDAEMHRKGIIK